MDWPLAAVAAVAVRPCLAFSFRILCQDSKDVFVLGSVEDITVALEDSLVTISTIATCLQALGVRSSGHWQELRTFKPPAVRLRLAAATLVPFVVRPKLMISFSTLQTMLAQYRPSPSYLNWSQVEQWQKDLLLFQDGRGTDLGHTKHWSKCAL